MICMMLLERKNSSDGKGIVQRNTLQGKTWHTRESEKGRQYLSLAAYHAMTLILRVCVKNAVSRRVVSRRIHSIGTSLVERCLHCPVSSLHTRDDESCRTYRKPHILRLRACDSNHGAVVVWSQSGSSEGSSTSPQIFDHNWSQQWIESENQGRGPKGYEDIISLKERIQGVI
jgi:hypothetical protein